MAIFGALISLHLSVEVKNVFEHAVASKSTASFVDRSCKNLEEVLYAF